MLKALVIVPIVGWAAIGAILHMTRDWPEPQPDQGTVIVVPPRAADRTAAVPPQTARPLPPASDKNALARELQKELKRVGCYDGEINGVWTTSSRQAMRDFTDRVNARLPVDQPDVILLRMVQGHPENVCGEGCSMGQTASGRGCLPSAIAAQTKLPVRESAPSDVHQATPAIVGAATTAAAVAAIPQTEAGAAVAKPANVSPPPRSDDERGQRSVRQDGATPASDLSRKERRYASRRAKSRPPAVVRSLVRNVQRALSSFGIK